MDRLAALERQVQQLLQEIRVRPIGRQISRPPAALQVKYLLIGGGNDIITNADGTWTGIKFQNSLTTFTVPAAAPTPGTTYADGLGYGTLYDENNNSLGTVWIIDAYVINGSSSDMVQQTVFTGGWYLNLFSIQVPIAGSSPTTYATCYIPWRS